MQIESKIVVASFVMREKAILDAAFEHAISALPLSFSFKPYVRLFNQFGTYVRWLQSLPLIRVLSDNSMISLTRRMS